MKAQGAEISLEKDIKKKTSARSSTLPLNTGREKHLRAAEMAEWINARLIVVGERSAVLHFSRRARTRPSSIFELDMLNGEAQDLFSERIERWTPEISRKKYVFQIRYSDLRIHFKEISRQFPSLWFVVVYGPDDYGSYLIRQGRCRSYSVPDKIVEAVARKHGAEDMSGNVDDDAWSGYWEASWELMDLAQAHWDDFLLRCATPTAA